MFITQKIHGSNGQIRIWQDPVGRVYCQAASRNRDLSTDDDNYGFAAYVKEHETEIIEKLGLGLHYGEWAGPGINSGEGLKEKTFVLFNHFTFKDVILPPRMTVVPLLYLGPIDTNIIQEVANNLKESGSHLVPGFMNVEGIVVMIGRSRHKLVFKDESTPIKQKEKKNQKPKDPKVDFSPYLHPLRLEKILSKDERLTRDFPNTKAEIVQLYIADLIEEKQIPGSDVEVSAIAKAIKSGVFMFVSNSLSKETHK